MSINVGPIQLPNRVLLAPMSGVSDAPFRAFAHECGAGMVVSEMVASRELVEQRADVVRRAAGRNQIWPFVIQLAGREEQWMAAGAQLAQDLGADIIDINMGCPARQVTGGFSGSALMRDLDHALRLIEATVAATKVPVTLKMRLGWDAGSINAPELARRAEAAGVQMITVHGRTRCQFYGGRADWHAIRAVKDEVSIPVIANGDCVDIQAAIAMLDASVADGVMIGRGSYGRPWWPGAIAEALEPGSGRRAPTLAEETILVLRHHESMLALYGHELGNKVARKHLGWLIERKREEGWIGTEEAGSWRDRVMRDTDNRRVALALKYFFFMLQDVGAEAA
jgi:tRNA-dihydrouridine synthase B